MNIDETISQFILDAQFRISELAIENENINDSDGYDAIDNDGKINEIYLLMGALYVGTSDIIDGYNLLDWTDQEINSAIEWVRNNTGMNSSPYVDFVGSYPQIVNNIIEGGGVGVNFPIGNQGDVLYYQTQGNNPVTVPLSSLVGQGDSDTIDTYFLGR